jgi:transposase-like protein
MKRRRWKPEQKALVVLEGLKGRPIGELCAEHEISQGQYYQWRDQFLANARESVRVGRRPPTPRPARTRERAAQEPGRRARPGAQKKPGDLRVKRGPYAKVAARNAQLLERIRALKAEHPFWGYRRIWAHLRYVDGLAVNQKRV